MIILLGLKSRGDSLWLRILSWITMAMIIVVVLFILCVAVNIAVA